MLSPIWLIHAKPLRPHVELGFAQFEHILNLNVQSIFRHTLSL